MKNVIVDGMNVAFRCSFIYDEKQGLKAPDGTPTGTLFGFLRHMVILRNQFPSAEIYVAWEGEDSSEARKSIFAPYKGNRTATPSEEDAEPTFRAKLFSQIPTLQKALTDLGISQITADGYEADDVIATLVREKLAGQPNVIVSSDKDFLQLVGSGTVQMTNEKFYDREAVIAKYGVPPELLLSYRVFDGDSSDNIPGMYRFPRAKIGSIVKEYSGSLEAIYAEPLEGLTAFQKKTLEDFQEQAAINLKLMTLQTIETYHTSDGSFDAEALEYLCNTMSMKSIQADLLSFSAKARTLKIGDGYVGLLYSES